MKTLKTIVVLITVAVSGCGLEFARERPEPVYEIIVPALPTSPPPYKEAYLGDILVEGRQVYYIDPNGVRQEMK